MKYLTTLLLLVTTSLIFGQNKVLKVEYAEIVTYIPEIVNNEKGILYVQNSEAFYKTIFDFSINNQIKDDEETLVVPVKEQDYFNEVYTDLKKRTLNENIFEKYALKKYYSIQENIPVFNWQLVNETKKINNYTCKKATLNFRGRNYVAWYTEDIPVALGPWKFSGLPGLILEIVDKQGIYKWYAKEIHYPYSKTFDFTAVKAKMQKFNQVSYKDFSHLVIDGLKNKYEGMKARQSSRSSKFSYGFSTDQWKEATNEYRTQMHYKF